MSEKMEITTQEIQAHFDANDRFGVIGGPHRTGFAKFITRLEWEHYDPKNEELNNRYQMFIIQHNGIPFVIISIPLEDRHLAEKIAAECDISFTDGVPAVFGGESKSPMFPIQHKNIWSAQNLPGSGVYKGDSNKLAQEEQAWLDEFWKDKNLD